MINRQITRRQLGTGIVGGVSLLLSGCLGDDGTDGHGDGHDVYTLEIIDRGSDEVVADYHGHWHGTLSTVPLGGHISLGANVEDGDSNDVLIGDTGFRLDVRVSDGEESIVSTESHGDHVHIHGEAAGETSVIIQLVDDGEIEWETSEPIGVEVTEE